MAFRLDVGSLRPPRTMHGGRLLVDGVLTRTGVFVYRNDDGTERREYRPDAEVFAEASLATLPGVPVTDDHPNEMLTIHDAAGKAVGAVAGPPRRDGKHLVATFSVWDAATIAKMKAGKTALSCGYEVDLKHESGTSPQGERYDAVQSNIRFNHLAIVDAARAGATARARMDAAQVFDSVEMESRAPAANLWISGPSSMSGQDLYDMVKRALRGADIAVGTVRRDSVEGELRAVTVATAYSSGLWVSSRTLSADQLTTTVEAALARAGVPTTRRDGRLDCACQGHDEDSTDEADPGGASADKTAGEKGPKMDELEKAKAEAAKQAARADGAEAALAAEKKARADEAAALPAKIKARVALQTAAAKALGDDTRLDDMSDEEIQRAVVKRIDGVEIPADKGSVYVAARYDSAIERAGAAPADPTSGLAHAREVLGQAAPRLDAGYGGAVAGISDKERAASAKARQDALNAWRK